MKMNEIAQLAKDKKEAEDLMHSIYQDFILKYPEFRTELKLTQFTVELAEGHPPLTISKVSITLY